MRNFILLLLCAGFCLGCRTTRQPEAVAPGTGLGLLTYNINWGGAGADQVAAIIQDSKADIVCLQETTPAWERLLLKELRSQFAFTSFKESEVRMGGGLAFFSKLPAREVAYIRSETGWFDGWIVEFQTAIGPVQVLNVHLRPPVSDQGGWISGYLGTRDDRVLEMERFYRHINPNVPLIVAGDFNDSENSRVVNWLENRGLTNALPQFDRSTPTWQWRYRGIKLRRRMDHIMYSHQLHCTASEVINEGPSDHFPVVASFRRK
jgi:endonuclease/exonuclease/phosphatase family metal-dependent hydrolase